MEKCPFCSYSGELKEVKMVAAQYKTHLICSTCSAALKICDDCGRLISPAYSSFIAVSLDNPIRKYVCTDCRRNYVECKWCGHLVIVGSLVRMSGNYRVCPACAHDTKICMCCRQLLFTDKFNTGEVYCVACQRGRSSFYTGIREAGFRPIPVFYGEEPYYGIELEIDAKEGDDDKWDIDECIENLNKLIISSRGRFFLKADGSLDNGFEIVSQPHSISEWESQTWLKDACKQVIYDGGVSFQNSKCGFHVHRSRKDLPEVVVVKLLTLFIKLQPFFEKVAQRKSNGYCKFSFLGTGGNDRLSGKLLYDRIKKQDSAIMDRYMALNITGPATIECRIFRGSLVHSTVLAYLKFFHLLCEFAKKKEITLRKILKLPSVELWEELCKHFEQDERLMAYLVGKRVLLKDCVK